MLYGRTGREGLQAKCVRRHWRPHGYGSGAARRDLPPPHSTRRPTRRGGASWRS